MPSMRQVLTLYRTGKYNPYVKWKKNFFRFFMVGVCATLAWVGANDLDKFVALVGSFACIPLVYIYPVSSFSLILV
jgi:proton-coupled amino acid transporter